MEPQTEEDGERSTGGERLVRDLVCGMEIDPAQTQWRDTYKKQTYFFCHPRCLGKFRTNPEMYLRAQSSRAREILHGPGEGGGQSRG